MQTRYGVPSVDLRVGKDQHAHTDDVTFAHLLYLQSPGGTLYTAEPVPLLSEPRTVAPSRRVRTFLQHNRTQRPCPSEPGRLIRCGYGVRLGQCSMGPNHFRHLVCSRPENIYFLASTWIENAMRIIILIGAGSGLCYGSSKLAFRSASEAQDGSVTAPAIGDG